MSNKLRLDPSLISKYKYELMGAAALTIMFMHGKNLLLRISNTPIRYCVNLLAQLGNAGVDIFLIVSGFGLVYSVSKNNRTYMQYLYRRITKLVIPFLLIVVPSWLIIGCNIKDYFLHISTMYFWVNGNDGTWFVSFILICYCVFYPVYKVIQKKGDVVLLFLSVITIALSLVIYFEFPEMSERIGIAIYRIPSFLIGLYLGRKSLNRQILSFWVMIPIFGIVVARQVFHLSNTGLEYYWPNICKSLIYMCAFLIIFCYLEKFSIFKKSVLHILNLLGGISLEIYLLHIMFLNYLDHNQLLEYQLIPIIYIAIIVISIVGGLLLQKFVIRIGTIITRGKTI